MLFKKIDIDKNNNVYLNCYLHEKEPRWDYGFDRPAVVVCPGGGYNMCSPREADPIALHYSAAGYNAFVLYYTVGENAAFPKPLVDLSKAMKIIRENAAEWGVISNKIAVLGFSAGGHLAASLGVHWNLPEVTQKSDCKNGENQPNALILCYPVITSGEYAHKGSFEHLIGNEDENLWKKYSLENQVNEGTPAAFLWHTFEDNLVPVENSMLYAQALRKNNIPFELHIYPDGPHGLDCVSEGTFWKIPKYTREYPWIEQSIEWLYLVFGITNIEK